MRLERKLALLAAAACAIPLSLWLITFWRPAFSTLTTDWAAFGDYVGGVLSPVLAFTSFLGLLFTIRIQRVASDDQQYFDHAVKSIERAFYVLSEGGNLTEPVCDRLAWLNAARLLLSSKLVGQKISDQSTGLRALLDGEEEHWRRQFYELLQPFSRRGVGAQVSFFQGDESENEVQIEERSIRVIYEFANWPVGKEDSIDGVATYASDELQEMTPGMFGVRDYVRTMPRFRQPQRDA